MHGPLRKKPLALSSSSIEAEAAKQADESTIRESDQHSMHHRVLRRSWLVLE